jgi:hypothetical protein
MTPVRLANDASWRLVEAGLLDEDHATLALLATAIGIRRVPAEGAITALGATRRDTLLSKVGIAPLVQQRLNRVPGALLRACRGCSDSLSDFRTLSGTGRAGLAALARPVRSGEWALPPMGGGRQAGGRFERCEEVGHRHRAPVI